ncbi:hypothetical protein K435DRAFT_784583 [Dendrothele bispora CBS 962.96]|uniref:Uncharacterized protein n=1 Tax=Dendrothele bispora (strain CBS 962.96) TaxID=1314807 RepID=A0A4S8L3G8_DENBC|nr:hypothetical protein K435DRAFT_784583 [Dendrothele bispora CBS 962.96]
MNTNTPPDVCNEQVPDCCCNSIAFGLSMLCLTCQQGFSHAPNGFDAGSGAYEIYLSANRPVGQFCSPNTNQSFPAQIQTAVCNQNIKIFDSMYNRIFWSDGSWFYEWSSQFLQKDIASTNGNTFTHCDTTTSSSQAAAAPNPPPSSPSTSPQNSQSPSSPGQNSSPNTSSLKDSSSSSRNNNNQNEASTSSTSSTSSTTTSFITSTDARGVTYTSPAPPWNSSSSSSSNHPNGPSSPSNPNGSNSQSGSSSTTLSPGIITGIVLGSIVVLVLWAVFFWLYRKKGWDVRKFTRPVSSVSSVTPFTATPTVGGVGGMGWGGGGGGSNTNSISSVTMPLNLAGVAMAGSESAAGGGGGGGGMREVREVRGRETRPPSYFASRSSAFMETPTTGTSSGGPTNETTNGHHAYVSSNHSFNINNRHSRFGSGSARDQV